MDYALKVDHLNQSYEDFGLQDVSIALPQGSIMGFIGENGAGKTTTIKAILGLIHRQGGSVQVFGKDLESQGQQIKEQIGVVFDENHFHECFRLKEVAKVMRCMYRNWDDSLFEAYQKRFHLPAKSTVKEYSRGMKMKLSLAVALSHHPKLLILDEATSGLDPVVREEVLDLLMEFIQEEDRAVLFSSHITTDLDKIADYVTFIHEGKIILSEEKDHLLYRCGVLKCGEALFQSLHSDQVLRYRKNSFGYEVLVNHASQMRTAYPDAVIDPASIEDIMLFFIRGKQK
jgi:ABC-2 type transport system ATP-binding protein